MIAAAALALGLAACSSPNFDNIPRNGYITHLQQAGANAPGFASYWAASKAQPAQSASQAIYVKPVSLDHCVSASSSHTATAAALRHYFDTQLGKALAAADAADPSFHLVPAPGKDAYTVEVAILSYQPTNIKGNAITTAASNLAGNLAGYLVSDSDDAGFICMGAKFRDPQGRLVTEVADWAKGDTGNNQGTQVNLGQYSFNIRDFQRTGYARQTINRWVSQLASLFSPICQPAPWYRLSGN